MAFKCEECRREISYDSAYCPHCGYPVRKPSLLRGLLLVATFAVFAWIVYGLVTGALNFSYTSYQKPRIGTAVKLGAIELTVSSIRAINTLQELYPLAGETVGGIYLIVFYTARNGGNDAASFGADNLRVMRGEAAYDPDRQATSYAESKFGLQKAPGVPAGGSRDGVAVFFLPDAISLWDLSVAYAGRETRIMLK